MTGITRAIHICRGNSAGAWNAQGGYGAIAAKIFPHLNMDVLLLEYDTPRAGNFAPLRHILPQHTVVLGLLTTKHGRLEDAATVEARIHEAAAYVPLERLALSPQCGFASVEAGNPLNHGGTGSQAPSGGTTRSAGVGVGRHHAGSGKRTIVR